MTDNGGAGMTGINKNSQARDTEEACEHDGSLTTPNSLLDQSEKDKVDSDILSGFDGESQFNDNTVWSPDANDTLSTSTENFRQGIAAKHAPPESQLVPSSTQTLETGRQAELNFPLLDSVGLQTC
ncbi:Hypothetical predicted protein [Cloeon dipterum]|uniref:Uncharacterized protein n=1 Tax=Cloeon dipterum TaxID=197152 RepID=A0A8S1E2R5_9INSE|nr:Hypothetical predicted protein [Cloeon dipterum]